MKISILISDGEHPVVPALRDWSEQQRRSGHSVDMVFSSKDLGGGDVLFLVSCNEIVGPDTRAGYGATLVLHASNLPEGRGWSPYIWAVLGGADRVHVCLLEAAEPVDTGDIWLRGSFPLEGHELLAEIHDRLFAVELELMSQAIDTWDEIRPEPQHRIEPATLPRRSPADSALDPALSLAAQFDKIRVADPERFPSFFDYRGHRYKVTIEKWPVPEEKA